MKKKTFFIKGKGGQSENHENSQILHYIWSLVENHFTPNLMFYTRFDPSLKMV